MIGKTIKGAGFRGLLDYLAGGEGAALVGGNMEGTNPRELAREFGFSRAMRPTLGKAVCHIPLRLPYDEHLSVAQWQRVAERVVAGMGFADCSYALYLHPQDPQGEHLHIVASRVTVLGEAVDDGHDMYRLMRIERQIEQDYGLRAMPLVRNAVRPRQAEAAGAHRGGSGAAAAAGGDRRRRQARAAGGGAGGGARAPGRRAAAVDQLDRADHRRALPPQRVQVQRLEPGRGLHLAGTLGAPWACLRPSARPAGTGGCREALRGARGGHRRQRGGGAGGSR